MRVWCVCVRLSISSVGCRTGQQAWPGRSSEPVDRLAGKACWGCYCQGGCFSPAVAVCVCRHGLFVASESCVVPHCSYPGKVCVCVLPRGALGLWAVERTLLCSCLRLEQKRRRRKTHVEGWLSGGMHELCRSLCPCRCVLCCRCCLFTCRVSCDVGGTWFSSGCEEGVVCSSSEPSGTVLASQLCVWHTHQVEPCDSTVRVLVATAYVQCHATQCPVSGCAVVCCFGSPVCEMW
jgi:hypothetical protein